MSLSNLFRWFSPILACACLGCDGAKTTKQATPTPDPPVQSVSSGAEGESAPPITPASEAQGSVPPSEPQSTKVTPFGVSECDNYVKQFLACVDGKVSGEQRDALMAGFEANRTKWRALSTMREGAVALGIACRAAAQKSRESLTVDYGCEF